MRILGEPDRPHEPRNEIEAHICKVLQTLTGQDIKKLQTRDEYRNTHFDEQETPHDPGYDFVVKTSKKYKEYYCKGLEFGVNVTDGSITTIQETGAWMT
jgi:hypothetical protein